MRSRFGHLTVTVAVSRTEVVARDSNVPLRSVEASIHGMIDRSRPVRGDVSVFNSVHLAVTP